MPVGQPRLSNFSIKSLLVVKIIMNDQDDDHVIIISHRKDRDMKMFHVFTCFMFTCIILSAICVCPLLPLYCRHGIMPCL